MNFRFLLYPLAFLYGMVIRTRNFLYNTGLFTITGFEYPTISVGNLSVGGTGKTPHIEYLLRLLKSNFTLATLSRGYGRKSRGFLSVKSNMPVAKTGDEPLQYKIKFPDVKVVVGEKRVKAMMSLLASYPMINVILLDDAFQHRSLKSGLSILLTDYKNLFCDDHLLPVGGLRESKSSSKRADFIIVTRTPDNATVDSLRRVKAKIKVAPLQFLFFTYMNYGPLHAVNEQFKMLQTGDLKDLRVLAFSGIARPGYFVAYLKNKCYSVKHIRYHDHHNFTEKNLEMIKKSFNAIPGNQKIIVTTEKDWMRIVNEPTRKIFDNLPVYTLEMTVDFTDPKEKEIFDRKILNYVEKNQPNRIFNR
jgi:tetraacyldisaccharide 4'-kinase